MKLLHLLGFVFIIISTSAEPPKRNPPFIGYPNRLHRNIKRPIPFPPPPPPGRRALFLQIRSDSPVPIVLKRPHHRLQHLHGPPPPPSSSIPQSPPRGRPVKFAINPMFVYKSTPLMNKHPRKPTSVMKLKINTKPHREYVYEKPFSSAPEHYKQPIENSIHLTNDHFGGPIHTVPAPNLGFHDNHIHYEQPILTPRPIPHYHQSQYQVTEEQTNDQTIQDVFTGQQKYYAPDPDPGLPAPKIPVSIDPFSVPSNGKPLPSDVQTNYLSEANAQAQAQAQAPHQLVNFVNSIPQQQLTDPYGIQIGNQPQLQQYILQQTSPSQQTPIAVYNPTYLVAQSNSLYNQHQQQLFRPNPHYLESLKANSVGADLTQEIASEGQILMAAKDVADQFEHDSAPQQPAFAALVGNPSEYNVGDGSNFINYQQQRLPINEGNEHQEHGYSGDSAALQGGFVVSNYFGNIQNPDSYQEQVNSGRNHLAQEQIDHNLHQYIDNGSVQAENSAHEEHQRLLQQQLGSSSLRIFVPDDDYQSENDLSFKRRSEDYTETEEQDEEKSEDKNTSSESSTEGTEED